MSSESAGQPSKIDSDTAPATPLGGVKIELLTALRFPFTQRDWLRNVILLAVFLFIPVLSTLTIYGYSYEITERLHRQRGGSYPLFDVKQFASYVTRGVWPFILMMMLQTFLVPIQVVLLDSTMVGTMATMQANQTVGVIFMSIVVPLVLIGSLLFGLVISVLATPFLLRAGLSQDFAQTFKFAWIKDYLRKMWFETTLVNLFAILASLVLMPLGCLVFCYGALVVATFLCVVGGHLDWQLYELYLARGGEPIPLKPLPADMPPVVQA